MGVRGIARQDGSSNRSPERLDPGRWPARFRRRPGRRQAHHRGRGVQAHVQVRARAAVHARRRAGRRRARASLHLGPRHDVGTAEPSPPRGVPRAGSKAPRTGARRHRHRRRLRVRVRGRHPGDHPHVHDDAGQVPGAEEPRQARRRTSGETRTAARLVHGGQGSGPRHRP